MAFTTPTIGRKLLNRRTLSSQNLSDDPTQDAVPGEYVGKDPYWMTYFRAQGQFPEAGNPGAAATPPPSTAAGNIATPPARTEAQKAATPIPPPTAIPGKGTKTSPTAERTEQAKKAVPPPRPASAGLTDIPDAKEPDIPGEKEAPKKIDSARFARKTPAATETNGAPAPTLSSVADSITALTGVPPTEPAPVNPVAPAPGVLPPAPEAKSIAAPEGQITQPVNEYANNLETHTGINQKNYVNLTEEGKQLYKDMETTNKELVDFNKKYPPDTQATSQAELTKEYGKKINAVLNHYTRQMSRNEELAFWDKMIGGLGKIAAGAAGMATSTPVGSMYKDTEVFDRAPMDAATKQQYEAQTKGMEEQRGKTEELLNYPEQRRKELIDKLKTQATIFKQVAVPTAGKEMTKQTDTVATTQGWKEEAILNKKYVPRDKKDSGAGDKNLEFKEFDRNTANTKAKLNTIRDEVFLDTTRLKTPKDFAQGFQRLIQSWGAQGGTTGYSYSPTDTQLLQRYADLKNNGFTAANGHHVDFQGNDAAIRKFMLDEYRNITNKVWEDYPSDRVAGEIGRNYYAIPTDSIIVKDGKGRPLGSWLQSDYDGKTRSAPPPPITGTEAAKNPTVIFFVTGNKVKDPKDPSKTIDETIRGTSNQLAELKKKYPKGFQVGK